MLVGLQNACGAHYVNEGSGPLTVCAEILFINGTALTTANYTVIVTIRYDQKTTDDRTASFSYAQSKFKIL